MKLLPQRARLLPRAAFVALAAILLAAVLSLRHIQVETHQQQIRRIGVDWQQRRLLTQVDYVKLRRVIDEAQARGTTSDADLGWSLAAMQRSPNALVHTRVMGLLELLARSSQTPVSHKKKITAAIVPYLGSQNQLDRLASGRVQRVLLGKTALR